MSVLTGSEIVKMGIVSGLSDPDAQIQPAGVDLTVDAIERFAGEFEITSRMFKLSETRPVERIGNVFLLSEGAYKATFSEAIQVPSDLVGLVFPRSTLLRSGLTVETAVWDPGYKGKGSVMLIVFNRNGARIERGARIAQVMFFKLSSIPEKLYRGAYQFEGLSR